MTDSASRRTLADKYELPTLTNLLRPTLKNRILSKAHWTEIRQFSTDLTLAQQRFGATVAKNLERLKTQTEAEKKRAYQSGLNQATESLLKSRINLHRTTEEQPAEIIELMFTAIEKVLGEASRNIVTAKLARAALKQQVDAHTVIGLTVHPNTVDAVDAEITNWRADTGGPRIELNTDATMAETDCDIETRFGTVRAGLNGQLAVLRRCLLKVNAP